MTELKIESLNKTSNINLTIKDKLYAAHNYRLISVNLSSPAFNAHLENITVEENEFNGFIQDLVRLEEIRQGKISLSAENPDEFELSFQSIDKLGHFEAALQLGIGEAYKNRLNFSFEIDPSSLPVILIHLQGCDISYRSDKKIKTKEYKQQHKTINEFLVEWDFVGVRSFQIKDEYSDLINPILELLKNNADGDEFANLISKEIENRYGLKMKASDRDVLIFSEKVINWWNKK